MDDLGDKHWNELVHENTIPLRAELIFLEEKCAGNDSKCLGAFLIQFILSGEKRISKSFIFVAKYVGNIDNLTDLKIFGSKMLQFLIIFWTEVVTNGGECKDDFFLFGIDLSILYTVQYFVVGSIPAMAIFSQGFIWSRHLKCCLQQILCVN